MIKKISLYSLVFCVVMLFIGSAFAEDNQKTVENKDYKRQEAQYHLSVGDKLKINVFNEEDLSGEYEIDREGNVTMPLIESVEARGKTVSEIEKEIVKRYKDGYLVNPDISVEVLNFRPFFIMGEVKKAGEYSYKNNLTVLSAVATAGGYTYRANKKKIVIERENLSGNKVQIIVQESDNVLPGDTIIVKERYF